jgi:hypothetical protein
VEDVGEVILEKIGFENGVAPLHPAPSPSPSPSASRGAEEEAAKRRRRRRRKRELFDAVKRAMDGWQREQEARRG